MKLTGRTRYRNKCTLFGGSKLVLQVECVKVTDNLDFYYTSTQNIWRDAKVEDLSILEKSFLSESILRNGGRADVAESIAHAIMGGDLD